MLCKKLNLLTSILVRSRRSYVELLRRFDVSIINEGNVGSRLSKYPKHTFKNNCYDLSKGFLMSRIPGCLFHVYLIKVKQAKIS